MFDIFSREGLIAFLYTLPALVLSLSIHEYAHAWVAYKLGDISQKIRGRLTLNPLAHIDPIGFIAIMLIGVGWGKPVTVDDRNFKDSRKGMMLTALAGPTSNLILAIVVTILLKVLYTVGAIEAMSASNIGNITINMLMTLISFNVIFCVFNLIPLPPLDGSKVLSYFLPQRARGFMYTLERYSFIIILFIYFTNITTYLIRPGYNLILKLLNWIMNL